MHRGHWLAATMLMVVCAPAVAQPPAQGKPALPIPPGDSSIAGRVIDRSTQRPLQGVIITLSTLGETRALVTHTDEDGHYEFTHVAAGQYRVTASHSGYVTTLFGSADGRAPLRSTDTAVALEPRQLRRGVDFALAHGATITGRVTRHDGRPLKDARILVLQVDIDNLTFPFDSSAETSAEGTYVLSSLPEGRYHVSAVWREKELPSSRTVSPARPIFHPGATGRDQTATVVLSAGATVSNIDIVFPPSELLHISGKIVRGSSRGEIEAFLMTGSAMQALTITADGSFTTPPLRGGRYAIVGRASSDDGFDAAMMTVDLDFDLDDQVLGLMPTGTISGRVVTEDGTPVSNEMQVAAVLADAGKELDEYRRDRSDIGPDGEFTVRGVFGQRIIRMVGITAGWKIARVLVGKSEVTTLSMAPGETIEVLVVLTRSQP